MSKFCYRKITWKYTWNDYNWIEWNNQIEIYKDKGFEYFFVSNHVTGNDGIPSLEILKIYTQKLLKSIGQISFEDWP